MPFSQDVRIEALVAAARHCCVCRRFKGIKVEVHHITPEAEGGPSTLDNAIVLCFDCHSEAGHYNRNHPRGTKYSREELRRQRDAWHTYVREHGVPTEPSLELVHTRHLLCRTLGGLRELLNGDLSRLPFDAQVLLADNPIRSFAEAIGAAYGWSRRSSAWGNSYESIAAYRNAHPEASDDQCEYFSATRPLVEQDLALAEDVISRHAHKEGALLSDLGEVHCFYERCGEDRYQEKIHLRPLLVAFLQVTNSSCTPVAIRAVSGKYVESKGSIAYRHHADDVGAPATVLLPAVDLLPGETLLVPEGVYLAPFRRHSDATELDSRGSGDLIYELLREEWPCDTVDDFRVIGPLLTAERVYIAGQQGILKEEVHSLNVTSTFTLNETWEVGSCPHLFWVSNEGVFRYGGTVLDKGESELCEQQIEVPAFAVRCRIVEMEAEITHVVDAVMRWADGRQVAFGSFDLTSGDYRDLALPGAGARRTLALSGYYLRLTRGDRSAESVRQQVVNANRYAARQSAQRLGVAGDAPEAGPGA